MAALHTDEVDLLLKRVVSRHGHMTSLGVFAADRIPSLRTIVRRTPVNQRCCFVVNTDPAHLPGKHWLAFMASHRGSTGSVSVDYFDSYGLPLETYQHVYAACQRKGWPQFRLCNRDMLQDVHSSLCGYYCVLFLYLCAYVTTFPSALLLLKRAAPSAVERDDFVVGTLHSVMHRRSLDLYNVRRRCTRSCNQCCCAANEY